MNQPICTLCPRKCKIDRKKSLGFCGAPLLPRVAKVMLHRWEEPCICYGAGSGAIFFSGCQLKCVFCQNKKISRTICGKEQNKDALADLFLQLEDQGACNINLVSPTPYLNEVIPALEKAKALGLSVPILMNSGGYETVEALKHLDGLVDIYLPDFKFYSSELALRYAKASDYSLRCMEALHEMHRQTGKPSRCGERLLRGVIVRHLVLPGCSADSVKIMKMLSEHFSNDDLILSIMRQYTPMVDGERYPELTRTVTSLEYNRVAKAAQSVGFTDIYTQSSDSIGESFVPDFDIFFDKIN